ncbi:hypothetical protein ASPACDRAFT_60680 [Aspergillus aculeatus ATCC 16872]|uniref:SRR1-like domain-containing protein n=1 Tax=Aspergillus aculeatus (strain ATCC 16872 / CBS 172.66 / WB 5094) TaxID=690307 RepID=A0A1L9WUM5_ASPA1|nr:uncharacterized protein ASPACDRAFT_60680 [Aspergillus aculeatus ATCC 16872]OJJ99861.1 hypothetical protein ASPACDRAFT_60680 [Aspergillus aculeatus ATCC 16872]
MPHTSRKKKPTTSTGPTKRTTITDATGWTHVTTTGNAHRAHRQHRPQSQPHPQPEQQQELLTPAEAPKSLTLPSLLTQYHAHRTKWTASTTAATLTATVRREFALEHEQHQEQEPARPDATREEPQTQTEPHLEPEQTQRTEQGAQSTTITTTTTTTTTPGITNIICIGLGSPSGFLRGGWVDRRSVSLYQLNALMSVVECLTANPTTSTVQIYAQDPVFNALDRQLLAALGITVVEHPDGFGKVNSNSLLFCPGAEKAHLEVLLARNPAGMVGGPLEDTGSDGIERFVARTGSVRLPRFEELKEAFWEMRVYYTQPVEEEIRED